MALLRNWTMDKPTMTVKSQPVQIATADGNEAVIASGLQPGQLVVSAGVHVLSPGQKVTIYQEMSSNSTTAGVLHTSVATKNVATSVTSAVTAPAATPAPVAAK